MRSFNFLDNDDDIDDVKCIEAIKLTLVIKLVNISDPN